MLKLYGRVIEFWVTPSVAPPGEPPCAGGVAASLAWRLVRAALPPRGEWPLLIALALLRGGARHLAGRKAPPVAGHEPADRHP
jgi:hypothetical protein